MDRSRQNIKKEIMPLNTTLDQFDLIDKLQITHFPQVHMEHFPEQITY